MTAERFDPRAKLALAIGIVLAGFATGTVTGQLLLVGALLGVVVLGPVALRTWARTLAPLGLLLVLLVVLNTLFYASGPAWVAVPIGPVRLAITPGGVETAVLISLRLLLVAGAATWFALGTTAERFEAGLVSLGVPWRAAFLLSLTVGLIPRLRGRFRAIEESRRTRGADLSGGPIARIRTRIPMLVPFLATVIREGFDLSSALTARGFENQGPRTSITTVAHRPADAVLYVLAVGFVLAGLAL